MTVHCKPLNHLRLALSTMPAQPRPLVTYEAAMPCLAGAQPGIVLSKDGEPSDGLHLLPESCVGLPPELRTYAVEAGSTHTVSLSHPIRKVFTVWDTWNAVDTAWLADEIDRVWATRPPTAGWCPCFRGQTGQLLPVPGKQKAEQERREHDCHPDAHQRHEDRSCDSQRPNDAVLDGQTDPTERAVPEAHRGRLRRASWSVWGTNRTARSTVATWKPDAESAKASWPSL